MEGSRDFHSKAMLSAVIGEGYKCDILYLPAKDSYTVSSDLQITHAFLSFPLKLAFLYG